MVVGMNLEDGRTAPKTQWLSPAWNGYGVGQCIPKTGCPETPSPYVLEDFVPAVLGSAGRRERKGINWPPNPEDFRRQESLGFKPAGQRIWEETQCVCMFVSKCVCVPVRLVSSLICVGVFKECVWTGLWLIFFLCHTMSGYISQVWVYCVCYSGCIAIQLYRWCDCVVVDIL